MNRSGPCMKQENQMQLVTFDQGFNRFAGLDLLVLG
jgi:hypothetical protein